jgi:hypothetical protein
VVLADGTVPVLDGIAALGTEPRTPEDIAVFELPPAGYDPYMFRIEPEPLRDWRPTSRLPRWAIPSAARSAWAGDASCPNVTQLPALDGVLIDANLAWRASALTTFLLTAQSTFIDSIAVGASGGLARSWDLRCAMPSGPG